MKSEYHKIHKPEPVAVIGMGCFFPLSSGLKPYWRLISQGKDAVTDVPDSHWLAEDYYDGDPKKPDHVYCKRGGFLSPVSFDPTEFAIPPSVLEATDTSQLLSLMAAKAALEDAGYGEDANFGRDRTSVIIGVTGTQELVIPLGARLGHPKWKKALEASGVDEETAREVIRRISDAYVPWQENSFPGLLGNVVAGRICNRLDFGGTNCVVDAACASSMSAINLALLELESHRSDMVVAGGVDAINDIFMHMCFSKTQILSPTGDARPFSRRADGTVLGEGLGILILKRLQDAEQDRDRIYAVIRGMGAASDGKAQSIYAPRREGQAKALKRAYDTAGVDPATVELVEAHGTGTRVGDTVEFNALGDVLGGSRKPGNRCAVGSVKSMIGHTKAAAGAAGLIKAVLALHHKILPPTLKAGDPDPKLGLGKTPFYLNATARPWISSNGHPRRAGVSAFGFGGSNYHMVLEEYRKEKSRISWDGSVEIAAFSAADAETLAGRIRALSEEIEPNADIGQWAFRLKKSRERFDQKAPFRLLLTLKTPWDRSPDWKPALERAADAVPQFVSDPTFRQNAVFFGGPDKPGKLAFVFPGQGSQYLGMGRDLACVFPDAVEILKTAEGVLDEPERLSDAIYPPFTENGRDRAHQEQVLQRTENAQPAIGAVSLAMLEAIRRFGIEPDAVCGHSFGELSALYAAGCMDPRTFSHLSAQRGRLMAKSGKENATEPSGMLAVKAPLPDIEKIIADIEEVALANRNTPDQGVLSGPMSGIQTAEQRCKDMGFGTVRLPVSAAFHSRFVKNAQQPFREVLKGVALEVPQIPVYANTTATPYPTDSEAMRDLLGNQIVHPVNFVEQIQNMFDAGIRTFVEVGPKNVLTGLIRTILKDRPASVMALDRSAGRGSGLQDLAETLCRLSAAGYPVDLNRWEETGEEPVRQRMRIPICGANYRAPQDHRSPLSRTETTPKPVHRTKADRAGGKMPLPPAKGPAQIERSVTQQWKRDIPTPNEKDRESMKEKHDRPESSIQALKVIREGLKSMQALQLQTAEAHKQFLESQTEASRTLRHMMERVGRMPGIDLSDTDSLEPRLATSDISAASNTTDPNTATPTSRGLATPSVERSETGKTGSAPETRDITAPLADDGENTKAEASGEIETVLLAVVSELTGYPVEMLSPEMDIETDLGIDSIKRVEILSKLEEKMPHLPAVSPEIMGELKTLGQISDYMTGTIGSRSAKPAHDGNRHSDEAAASADNGDTASTLLAVVSQLTGYPPEMLSMEMDIETDLGIDSIKRVEILSTLEEKMPHLPPVSPEIMGELKTLGQIVDYMSETNGNGSADPASGENRRSEKEAAAPADSGETASTLLAVVSQLTGYPPEMISMEMDIETDLGIDSIKRVEILSTLEEKMPHLPPVSPEAMGELKTLGQIVDSLTGETATPGSVDDPTSAETTQSPATTVASESVPAGQKAFGTSKVVRRVVSIVPTPLSPNDLPDGGLKGKIIVTDDRTGLAVAIVKKLAEHGLDPELMSEMAADRMIGGTGSYENLSGLILMPNPIAPELADELKNAFLLAKQTGPALIKAAASGTALFAAITRLDGAFGFKGRGLKHAELGGLAGLVKTAALEWPGVTCRALDVAPQWQDTGRQADAIVHELLHGNVTTPVEVGMDAGSRVTLSVSDGEYPKGEIDLAPGEVVVISGGARGVTAAVAERLCQRTGARLLLLGRSPMPTPEPDWLAGLRDEAAVKRAILEVQFNGEPVHPKKIETAYNFHMANREILSTLRRIEASGNRVRYVSADVRDRAVILKTIEQIKRQWGPVRCLIHAAGTIEDRLIVDKTADQFDRVLHTKVSGLRHLLEAVGGDPLRYLVLFSSVSARFGNVGQADYAMANEVLNKIAQQESRRRTDCRVISVNWGPWDGGMVSPALKRSFERRNIPLIPMDAGAESLICEMAGDETGPVEVVMGGAILPGSSAVKATPQPQAQSEDLRLTVKKEIDVDGYPILGAHVLDGKPVVPVALMTEWLGHGALHGNPGLMLHGLDDLRVLSGIKLDQIKKNIRLMAGKPVKKGTDFEVAVEIRDGIKKDGTDRIHTRARAILTESFSEPPPFKDFSAIVEKPYTRVMDEVYNTILFHGADLHGISRILGYSKKGMAARVSAAPSPEQWIREPFRSRWIADPLVLDSAFQMAILWCFEAKGMVSLPSYSASYRQYTERFPENGVTAVLEVDRADDHRMKGKFTFIDDASRVIARIEGYEAIMDPSLTKAFRRMHAA